MEILAEKPLHLSVFVGLVAGALLYAWVQTGNKKMGIGGTLVALLIPLVWIVAGQWETDREQIQALIKKTATAVENNDHDTAVRVIGDQPTREQALAELPRYIFDHVNVSNAKIEVLDRTPKIAEVELLATVVASDKSGRLQNMRVLRKIILTFEQTGDDRWVVTDYNHMPMNGQPDSYSPQNIVGQRSTVRN